MSLTKLDITKTQPLAGGQRFGDVGPYQVREGTAHFAIDPMHRANNAITDVKLAPRDSQGRVHFSADFLMLQPDDPDKGNHRVLFDVVNRGNRTAVTGFNSAPKVDLTAPPDPGNGFLMRRGYSVVFAGWQLDVASEPGLIGLSAPQALGSDGSPIPGRIFSFFQVNEPTQVLRLSNRNHSVHPAADPDENGATLQVKDHPNGPATPIDRNAWSLVRVEDAQVEPEPSHVYMESGFEPGRIYELVYTTTGSEVVGLGFASVRDTVSFLKYASADAGNPCADDIEFAYAAGRSQSGRFLRQMLNLGLNEDEEGRMALDGVIAHVAGAMQGEFNLRYGQPSQDLCFLLPESFPFTDTQQTDPVTGDKGSVLERLEESGNVPKVMFTNTSAEYWRGDAALIHTDLETITDAPEDSDHVRRYLFAGTQHGVGEFPPLEVREIDGAKGAMSFNSVDYGPVWRACLETLDQWVSGGEPAPASRHPSLADGTAVPSADLLKSFPKIPGVRLPKEATRLMRLDYGPERSQGRITTLPPVPGEEFPALVSDVDDDGNEVSGIRLPVISVPVATYTGWNPRHESIGNPDIPIGLTGGLAGATVPFAANEAQRVASGDPRPSIEERYESRDAYLDRVREAADGLVAERYMLQEDVERVLEDAAVRYDYFVQPAKG